MQASNPIEIDRDLREEFLNVFKFIALGQITLDQLVIDGSLEIVE